MGCQTFRIGDCRHHWRSHVEPCAIHIDDMHLLGEVIDGERAAEARGAKCRKHVARTSEVITNRGRGKRTKENSAGMTNA